MKYKIVLIFIFLVSLVLSTGCGLLPMEDERLTPPIKEAREVEYRTEEIIRMDIEKKLALYAQWRAASQVYYQFTEFNAPFLEYRVSKGDYIEPGDILAVLDIGDIDKELRDMEITYQRQKLSYERILEKYEAGQASGYDLRIAELDFEDATNKLNDLKERKKNSLLVADVYGIVSVLMNYEPGDMVNTGINMVTVVRNDDIILQASSRLVQSSNLKIGDKAVLESMGVFMGGSVSGISGSMVTIEPEYMLDEWELGSSVKVDIPLESSKNALVINRDAVRAVGGKNYVRMLIDGIAIEKEIEIGISSGRYREVISGLEEGDVVILN
jgi:macrolide-specific efflux system membrane fusion protein